MPRLKHLWIGPLLGFFIGLLLVPRDDKEFIERFVGACIFGLFALMIQLFIQYIIKLVLHTKHGFLRREKNFIESILILAAEMTKVDGEISPSEIKVIEDKIRDDFNENDIEKYLALFHQYLKQENSIDKICKTIDYDFDDSTKAHLLYLLIGIATADGILSETELSLLKRICSRSGISITILISTLKIFQFKREGYNKNEQQSKRQTRSSQTQLQQAYEIIGVSENSSADAIKKAYRKLAKLHHPDRVIHLGEQFQEKAKVKFQEIADAYDTIKSNRKFN